MAATPKKPTDRKLNQPADVSERDPGPSGQANSTSGKTPIELGAFFDRVPLPMIIVDRDRRVCRMNRAAAAMSNRSESAAIGLRGGEILRCVNAFDDPGGCGFSDACASCIVRNTVLDTFRSGRDHQLIEAPIPYGVEDRDDVMWVLVSTALLELSEGPRVLVCLEDITDRKQAEEALRKSEQKFRRVTESIHEVFWMSTRGIGEMLYISPAYEALWGRSRESLYRSPRSFLEAVHPDDRSRLTRVLEQYHQTGKPYVCEYRIVRESGDIRWIQEKGYPVSQYADGNELMSGVCMDITDLKQAEIALRATNRELHTRGRIADLFLTRPGNQAFAEILDLLLEEMDSQFGYFGYIDDQGSLICPSMTRGIWDQCRIPDKHIVFPRDCWGGLWGKSLQEMVSLRQNDQLNLPHGHLLLQNALVVPLILEKKLVGQIAVANHPAGYTPQDQEKLESIAQFIAPILKIYIEKESSQQKARSHADKLQERNIALKVLLETRDEEKQQQLDRVAGNFERLVLPYFEKMMRCRTVEEIQTLLAIVESNTHDCLAPIETGTPKLHRLLTPMESQVADLIKAGKTSKEIAALLTISPRAVYFHRNNIRKKLDLRNTKANLRSLLNSYR